MGAGRKSDFKVGCKVLSFGKDKEWSSEKSYRNPEEWRVLGEMLFRFVEFK